MLGKRLYCSIELVGEDPTGFFFFFFCWMLVSILLHSGSFWISYGWVDDGGCLLMVADDGGCVGCVGSVREMSAIKK